jgi:5-methyltetrahydropteroyltriglutamate--homocysteine methyltransferase
MKTPRTAALPPFFTQIIGSLPRPKAVLDLLARRAELGEERFQAAMNDMVVFAIRLQEQAGLDVVSDGEWRRTHYVGEFLKRVGGFERVRKFTHQGETKYTDVVVRKMDGGGSVFGEDAAFLARHTSRVTKFALPSPFLVAIRYWHEDYSKEAYPTPEHFMEHLTDILSAEVRALVAAGIDIVQLDDPALTYFCDRRLTETSDSHDERLRRHWDADRQFPQAVACINRLVECASATQRPGTNSGPHALAGKPPVAPLRGAEVHLHCCHSVYKRRSDVTGDYKPILPRLAAAKIDRVNLEFAYQGTGQMDDLKLLPAHIDIGLGVVDVRGSNLQSVDEIAALGAAAAKMLPPKRIALNPDCGFAPDAGEPPTIDEAFEKLQRMVGAAKQLRKQIAY